MPKDQNDPLKDLAPKLAGLIRLSSALNGKDINFYKSIDKNIKEGANHATNELADLINRVVRSAITISTDLDPAEFQIKTGDENDAKNMKVIGNVLDSLSESTELSLAGYKRAKEQPGSVQESARGSQGDGFTYLEDGDASIDAAVPGKDGSGPLIKKPQVAFNPPIDNSEKHPFLPHIDSKPHAQIPFAETMKLVPATEEVPEHYNNPYSYEIMHSKYPEWIFKPIKHPYTSVPWKGSPVPKWIDRPEQLDDLIAELCQCKVIGVDLEHHDYRTYYGLTSLMQITTDSGHDYLVDPLSPSLLPHLHRLNAAFADPNIIKVFHGAFMDTVWLQRDLGLYVVSLFDTFWAAKMLQLGKYSLAFLLEKYIRFRTSKKWQLADWRLRPLNTQMRNYAKADSHFLIELFGKLQAALLAKPGALKQVLYHSRKVSDRRFEYASFRPRHPTNYGVVSTQGSVPLRPEYEDQLFSFNDERILPWFPLMRANSLSTAKAPVVEALYKWRDSRARQEDESPRYIMADFVLVSLANAFIPSAFDQVTETAVLGVIDRSARFGSSFFVRRCVKELTLLIRAVMRQLERHIREGGELGSEALASNVKKSGDVYESVKDLDRLEEEFGELQKIQSNQVEGKKPEDQQSAVMKAAEGVGENEYKAIKPQRSTAVFELSDNSNDKDILGVSYNHRKPVPIGSDDASKRLEAAFHHLSIYKAPVLVVEEKEKPEEIPAVEETNEAKEETPSRVNPDEIITLRKHRKHRNRRKKASSEHDSIDLTKKIIEPLPQGRKRKRHNKKRSYNPYKNADAQNPDIPLARKRKKREMGKQAVFKH